MRRSLLLIFLFVFVDVLGFSIILPLIPYFGKEFGSSSSLLGLLFTANALSQLLSAPLIGLLSDQYGRKPLLLVCLLSTVISFLMLAFATNLETVFISRIVDGVFGGNIALAQTYIADITTSAERSKGMGLIGAAFGLGFIVGPAAGGFLARYGYKVPSLAAAILSVLNLVGVFFFLEESMKLPQEKSQEPKAENKDKKSDSAFPSLNFFKYLNQPHLGSLMIVRFVNGMIFTMFETGFGMHNMHILKLDASSSSFLLCFVGIVYSIVQARGVSLIPAFKMSETTVMRYSFVGLAIAYLGWAMVTNMILVLFFLFFFSLFSGLLNTLINSAISKEVEQSKLGGTMGLSASIGSLTRVVAPLTSGLFIDYWGLRSPSIFGCILIIVLLLFWRPKPRPGATGDLKSH